MDTSIPDHLAKRVEDAIADGRARDLAEVVEAGLAALSAEETEAWLRDAVLPTIAQNDAARCISAEAVWRELTALHASRLAQD